MELTLHCYIVVKLKNNRKIKNAYYFCINYLLKIYIMDVISKKTCYFNIIVLHVFLLKLTNFVNIRTVSLKINENPFILKET